MGNMFSIVEGLIQCGKSSSAEDHRGEKAVTIEKLFKDSKNVGIRIDQVEVEEFLSKHGINWTSLAEPFFTALGSEGEIPKEELVRRIAFEALDRDKDGSIDRSDLEFLLQKFEVSSVKESAMELLVLYDEDKDGKSDKEEFGLFFKEMSL